MYEYYWERNFPQTPTVHAVRDAQYKYIRYQGLWDIDELYDLQADPLEARNLIFSPAHEAIARRLNGQLFDILEATGGMAIPMARDAGLRAMLRRRAGAAQGTFPPQVFRPAGPGTR